MCDYPVQIVASKESAQIQYIKVAFTLQFSFCAKDFFTESLYQNICSDLSDIIEKSNMSNKRHGSKRKRCHFVIFRSRALREGQDFVLLCSLHPNYERQGLEIQYFSKQKSRCSELFRDGTSITFYCYIDKKCCRCNVTAPFPVQWKEIDLIICVQKWRFTSTTKYYTPRIIATTVLRISMERIWYMDCMWLFCLHVERQLQVTIVLMMPSCDTSLLVQHQICSRRGPWLRKLFHRVWCCEMVNSQSFVIIVPMRRIPAEWVGYLEIFAGHHQRVLHLELWQIEACVFDVLWVLKSCCHSAIFESRCASAVKVGPQRWNEILTLARLPSFRGEESVKTCQSERHILSKAKNRDILRGF